MAAFAMIEKSPGGLGGYTTQIGKRLIWTSGGVAHLLDALCEESKVRGKAATKLRAIVTEALRQGRGTFALVALPERRRKATVKGGA